MPLVVTVHGAKDGNALVVACCIECQETGGGREWLDWVETILVYKLPRLSREESQTMLGLCAVELNRARSARNLRRSPAALAHLGRPPARLSVARYPAGHPVAPADVILGRTYRGFSQNQPDERPAQASLFDACGRVLHAHHHTENYW